MLIVDAWNVFKTTGRVEDYLEYKNNNKESTSTSKNDESPLAQEGETKLDGTNKINRDGIVSNVHRGI